MISGIDLSGYQGVVVGVAALWIYSAAVAALPEPGAASTKFYTWAYKFLKAISGDLTAKFGTYIPNTTVTTTLSGSDTATTTIAAKPLIDGLNK